MKTEALDFCKKYQESIRNKEILENEKILKNETNSFIIKFDKELIDFYIALKEKYESNTFLLKLDEEDLQYLYEKYSKKAKEELEQNIEELKEKYKL